MKMRSYSDMPEEVTVDILSRLPVKSVGRCRCVSKPWGRLLSRPDFIKTHLHRSRNLRPESLLLSHPKKLPYPFYYASLSNLISAKRLNFSIEHNFATNAYGSCDGLLLLGNQNGKLFVLNPITDETREVPNSPFALNLGSCRILYGFGYDYVSDDYKIVTISYPILSLSDGIGSLGYNTEMFANVFSLKTGAWSKCENSSFLCFFDQFTTLAFVDGCIHGVGWTLDWKPTIVAFDLTQEKFREIAFPSSIDSTEYSVNAGVVALRGCLCIFNKKKKDFWVMKEYGAQESWTKFMIADTKVVETKPICMLGKEQVVLKDGEKLIIYNLAKRIEEDDEEKIVKDILLKDIRCDPVNESSFGESLVLPLTSFVESLVSPHGMNGTT